MASDFELISRHRLRRTWLLLHGPGETAPPPSALWLWKPVFLFNVSRGDRPNPNSSLGLSVSSFLLHSCKKVRSLLPTLLHGPMHLAQYWHVRIGRMWAGGSKWRKGSLQLTLLHSDPQSMSSDKCIYPCTTITQIRIQNFSIPSTYPSSHQLEHRKLKSGDRDQTRGYSGWRIRGLAAKRHKGTLGVMETFCLSIGVVIIPGCRRSSRLFYTSRGCILLYTSYMSMKLTENLPWC